METFGRRKDEISKLYFIEMKFLRSMACVTMVDRRRNEEVRRRVGATGKTNDLLNWKVLKRLNMRSVGEGNAVYKKNVCV